MKYYLDSANPALIKECLEYYPIAGITTNPSIIAKEKKGYLSLLQELDVILMGKDFHVQLTSEHYDGMIMEALMLKEHIKGNLFFKIPVSKDGLKAIRYLSSLGHQVTATAITSLNQGVMASLAGAKYLAIYVNRISNTGKDGVIVVEELAKVLRDSHLDTIILGASYKSVTQINESILHGCLAVTIPPDLFLPLIETQTTTLSIQKFTKDVLDTYGVTGVDLLKGGKVK
ncbi:MAG: fructose-6-phosphate aldolase [Firmicutes bacterium]|nr:fructose-6-phosphate aldolase [Bacillota bacterium]